MSEASTRGARSWTVGRYLSTRLYEMGVHHLFGVPGNHLGPFLTTLDREGRVEWIGTPTEGGAGQAADAYARVRGVGATAVTYGVGAFNLLNAVGGAYVEFVPLVAINASPSFEQWLNYREVGLLASHMSQRQESNLEVFRQVTVDAQVVSQSGLAPQQIDGALTRCLTERRPVYLEVMEDVWDAPCEAPSGTLRARERTLTERNREMTGAAVTAVVELIRNHPGPGKPTGKPRPILLVGEEIDRAGLAGPLERLLEATGMPYCTTVGAKSVLSEYSAGFHGVYNGRSSLAEVRTVFAEVATCRIGLGNWATSHNLAGERTVGTDWAVAARGGISVGTTYFPDVRLAQLLPALQTALVGAFGEGAFEADYFTAGKKEGKLRQPGSVKEFRRSLLPKGRPAKRDPLTIDGFFTSVNGFLDSVSESGQTPFTVVSDAGFGLLGSMNLLMPEPGGYLAQNSWLSIGYSMGAATGVGLSRRERRPMVFVGDGSFQETCQELSTHTRHGLPCVVFVMDNESFYGIEQMLVSPCYYKQPGTSDGADHYNFLHPWHYERLAEVFAGPKTPATGLSVATHGELATLLKRLGDPTDSLNDGPTLVRVRLGRHDYPRALAHKLANCP